MQSGNLYVYCLNSPNDYLDESGRMAVAIVSCSLLGVICAFLGVAVGGHALAVLIEEQWDSLCTALWLKPSWEKSLIQMAEETEKDVEADTGNQEESKKSFPTQSEEKMFPEDPDDFNPDGLTRKEFQTPNGKVIKWFNEDGQAVYEWDEDLSHGSHYHILDENGRTRIPGPNGNTHRYPGERY